MIGTFPEYGFPTDWAPEDSFPSSFAPSIRGKVTGSSALAYTVAVRMATELAVGVSASNSYAGSLAASDE